MRNEVAVYVQLSSFVVLSWPCEVQDMIIMMHVSVLSNPYLLLSNLSLPTDDCLVPDPPHVAPPGPGLWGLPSPPGGGVQELPPPHQTRKDQSQPAAEDLCKSEPSLSLCLSLSLFLSRSHNSLNIDIK